MSTVSKWVPEEDLSACRRALRLMDGADAGAAWTEAVARLELGVEAGVEGGDALLSWRTAADLLEGVDGGVAVGAVAAGLRLGVPVSLLAATVPLELLVPRADAPRLRLRLVARGFSREAEGWLAGPAGGRVVVRDRLVPAGFGSVPVLVFAEEARGVEMSDVRLPVAAPGASWAAALARAGIGALAGSRWARLALTVAALEARGLDAAERERWRKRLRLWGIGRLVAVVEAWLAWLESGGEGAGRLPDLPAAGGSRRGRLLAGMKLQDGVSAALRFAAAQLLGGGAAGWE